MVKHKLSRISKSLHKNNLVISSLDSYEASVKPDCRYEVVKPSARPEVDLPFQAVTPQRLSVSQSSA